MAKFTGQFDRHPPNHSQPSIAIPTWPTLIRDDALNILSGFDDEMLVEIGLALEKIIETAAQPFNFPVNKDALIWTRIEPHWVSPTFAPKSANEIRNTFGDLNIFLCQCESPDEWELEYKLAFAPKVERWHLLAVLALWKLVDCSDVMFGTTAHTIDGMIPKNAGLRFQNAAGLAMEAQAALSTAVQKQLESQLVAAARRETVLSLEIEATTAKSQRGTELATKMHAARRGEARKIAFEIANECGLPKRIQAARHANKILKEVHKKFFTDDTVDEWLKEDGWVAKQPPEPVDTSR